MAITVSRKYSSRRQAIVEALCTKLKGIDGTGYYLTNLSDNVSPRLVFWDEVQEFPSVSINAGREIRDYQGAGYKDRYLTITLRCYVNSEGAEAALSDLLEDIETVIEENSCLDYIDRQGQPQKTHQMSVAEINTDEGVLEPLGVGEMTIEVRY